MGCASCGGRARARIAGGTPSNPLVLGEANGETAQPVTLLADIGTNKAGAFVYVSGDGVEQALADEQIVKGYKMKRKPNATAQKQRSTEPFYVKIGNEKYAGFKTLPAAERYAAQVKSVVITREQLLAEGL